MAEKKLNLARLRLVMEEKGLNAAAIADQLGVSRTIVSDWLRGKKFPGPKNLLDLGKLLGLRFSELVIKDMVAEPVVAYRHKAHVKENDADALRSRSIARAVRLLVPLLPFNRLDAPARYIRPQADEVYIVEAAREARSSMNLAGERVEFKDIIRLFGNLKTVLVPVLWGKTGSRDNGLHVFLPDSETSVVFLNLDVHLHDFRFWMLHEYAHAKLQGTIGGEAEEGFAERFAALVLFPDKLAQTALERVRRARSEGGRIKVAIEIAEELEISPVTVASRVDELSRIRGEGILLGTAIHAATANLNKRHKLVSAALFGAGPIEAADLIRIAESVFQCGLYEALRRYLDEHPDSESMIAASLGIGAMDAKAVRDALRAH
ncbi:MAG: XRE family transcriptional regulator [Spirochaetota bacterium]